MIEKRSKLEAFFHDSRTFYLQNEVEKLAPKETKMRPDAVLETLKDLVDDGLVKKEKIGRRIPIKTANMT